jgi:hypothetical protein
LIHVQSSLLVVKYHAKKMLRVRTGFPQMFADECTQMNADLSERKFTEIGVSYVLLYRQMRIAFSDKERHADFYDNYDLRRQT